MTSIDISHFNIIDDGGTVFKSSLDETSKQSLAKAIKKRKKVVDADLVIGDTFFLYPRERSANYIAYILAESCAHNRPSKIKHEPVFNRVYELLRDQICRGTAAGRADQ